MTTRSDSRLSTLDSRLRIAMIAPTRAQCGIADYTHYLLPELRQRVDVAFVADAKDFTPEMNAVDLIHIQHQYFLFGGVAPWKNRFSALARRLKAPAVMTVHEFVSPTGGALRRAAIARTNRLNFLPPAVRRLLVHTEADRARMVEAGLPPDCIVVVRHGVPHAPALPPREEARRALDVEDRFVVTLFGFLSRRKGHNLALDALAQLQDNVLFLFAGGRHPDDTTDYVNDLQSAISNQQSKTRITGYLTSERVAEAMSATDLVIAPFLESSGSGSLALGLACGKPILASDIAPHREIVRDAPGALTLFPSGSAESLAEGIMLSMNNQEQREAMARASRRYAETHSYARMAEETVKVYHDALAR